MKKTLTYLKDYKKEVVLGPLFKLIEASFELIIPLLVADIIDRGIADGDIPRAVRGAVFMVVLSILGLTFSVTAQYFCANAAVGFATKVRNALFEKIQHLTHSEVDTYTQSTLITRLTGDVNTMQNGVNLVLRLFLRSPFIVFGAAIMAFFVDSASAVWFVIVIPLLAIVVYGIMLLSIPLQKKVQKKLERVLTLTRENAGGARVIRAFAREDEEIENFENENRALVSLQKKVGSLAALTNPVTYVLINGATIALLYTGAVRVDSGAIAVGTVVALFNYMSQILVELIKLANLIVTTTKAIASADRVENILFAPEEEKKTASDKSFDGAVSFESVTLRYTDGADPSLSDISFCAKEGATVGIIGSTGSGKTSLINLIGGLYTASEGTVSVFGKDVLSYTKEELLSKIAYVPQKAILFKGTVRENLLFASPEATDVELWEALSLAQADDFIREKEGLDTPVSEGGSNFSGGQRQRLTIARALAKKAPILILDDSASALDYATEKKLRASIASLDYAPTVFIVSQRTSSIMHADLIIVLDDGQAVGMGTHDELLCECDVYREIYDSQFKGGSAK